MSSCLDEANCLPSETLVSPPVPDGTAHDELSSTINGVCNTHTESHNSNSGTTAAADQPANGKTPGVSESIEGEDQMEPRVFTVKLLVPGLQEHISAQVSEKDSIQELRQVLLDRQDTCYRTCYSIQHDGVRLDDFAEIGTIEGLSDGTLFKVVDEPYTHREARIHVRRLRDILCTSLVYCAYTATDFMSLSFCSPVSGLVGSDDTLKALKDQPEPVDVQAFASVTQNSAEESSLLPLCPPMEHKNMVCLQEMRFSGWNPVPGHRKLAGDLLYLEVNTLENISVCITASVTGFYVNRCTPSVFDPRPAQDSFKSFHLVLLLNQLSSGFRKNFSAHQKMSIRRHPLEVLPTPYQCYPWVSPALEHSYDPFRSEDAFAGRVGYEDQIPGQLRDWNEELQSARELPKKTRQQRLIQERALFKINTDFVAAATKGAVAVVDGNVLALNPFEEEKMRMFIWNNMFFSFACDSRDHFKKIGGDEAAHVAAGLDVKGVSLYNKLDVEGLHTLGTVVIDYKGHRVVAQTIVPGILQRDQDNSIVYGSLDDGKTIHSNAKFSSLMLQVSTKLRFRSHRVFDGTNTEHLLHSSLECKGVDGADGRQYVLDLYRTFPPDANFLEGLEVEAVSKGEGVNSGFQFPRASRHQLYSLRPELIDTFVYYKYLAHFKLVCVVPENKGSEGAPCCNHDISSTVHQTSQPGMPHTEQAPSLSSSCCDAHHAKTVEMATTSPRLALVPDPYHVNKTTGELDINIAFNNDVYSDTYKYPQSEVDAVTADKELIREASKFLTSTVIPSLIQSFVNLSVKPLDGEAFTKALHSKGVNIRYLGFIAMLVSSKPDLMHIRNLCIMEMIVRVAKRVFRSSLRTATIRNEASATSHFLNCFLGTFPNPHYQVVQDDVMVRSSKRRARKKAGKPVSPLPAASALPKGCSYAWHLFTPEQMFKVITKEVESCYGFKLEGSSMTELLQTYHIKRLPVLRSFCKKLGVQLLLREYDFFGSKQTFCEEDVMNLFPVVKHWAPQATEGNLCFEEAGNCLNNDNIVDAHTLLLSALNSYHQIYGPIHADIAECYSMLANLQLLTGETMEAVTLQRKALMVLERVQGIDHPDTILAHIDLASYCFSAELIPAAFKLMCRAWYLTQLVHGPDHPVIALIETSLGRMSFSQRELGIAFSLLNSALKRQSVFYGQESYHTAKIHHYLAEGHAVKGDFRAALSAEKTAYSLFKKCLGENHPQTQDSSALLGAFTQQAVALQRKLNEIGGLSLTDLDKSCEDVKRELVSMMTKSVQQNKPQKPRK